MHPYLSTPDPPFCIQVELVEGCSLSCSFCGINGIREKPGGFKYMDAITALRIATQIRAHGWNPRIEFAMHGEPSVHPDKIEFVRAFRQQLPKHHLMMTSNGTGFQDVEQICEIRVAGLNVLALDWYEGVKFVPNIIERYPNRIHYYPDDQTANPHKRRQAWEWHLVVVRDISSSSQGNHATLNNHCGGGAPPNNSAAGKRCAKPFRELSIRWDGNVSVCCNDFRGVYRVGNINEMSLSEIWESERMNAARKFLYHGKREFAPCQGCDALSYRPGLLPDKKGQHSLPEPDGTDHRIVKEAIADGPYTLPVLREYEIHGNQS